MLKRTLAVLVLVIGLSGCSLVLVEGPPQVRPGSTPPATANCTTEMALPIVDLVFGALAGISSLTLGEDEITLATGSALWGATLLYSGYTGRKRVTACRDFLSTPVGSPSPEPVRLLPDTEGAMWSPQAGWRR